MNIYSSDVFAIKLMRIHYLHVAILTCQHEFICPMGSQVAGVMGQAGQMSALFLAIE